MSNQVTNCFGAAWVGRVYLVKGERVGSFCKQDARNSISVTKRNKNWSSPRSRWVLYLFARKIAEGTFNPIQNFRFEDCLLPPKFVLQRFGKELNLKKRSASNLGLKIPLRFDCKSDDLWEIWSQAISLRLLPVLKQSASPSFLR